MTMKNNHYIFIIFFSMTSVFLSLLICLLTWDSNTTNVNTPTTSHARVHTPTPTHTNTRSHTHTHPTTYTRTHLLYITIPFITTRVCVCMCVFSTYRLCLWASVSAVGFNKSGVFQRHLEGLHFISEGQGDVGGWSVCVCVYERDSPRPVCACVCVCVCVCERHSPRSVWRAQRTVCCHGDAL